MSDLAGIALELTVWMYHYVRDPGDAAEAGTGIPGLPPSLLDVPSGCVFHTRGPLVADRCRTEVPKLRELQPDLAVACHFAT